MAYLARNLSVLAYANGFTLWHYAFNTDTAAVVYTIGYFNPAADMLRKGDMILANVNGGAGLLLIAASQNGTVDVADMTAVGSVNTD